MKQGTKNTVSVSDSVVKAARDLSAAFAGLASAGKSTRACAIGLGKAIASAYKPKERKAALDAAWQLVDLSGVKESTSKVYKVYCKEACRLPKANAGNAKPHTVAASTGTGTASTASTGTASTGTGTGTASTEKPLIASTKAAKLAIMLRAFNACGVRTLDEALELVRAAWKVR